MTFPKIYQRKASCVNYASMMIEVSMATVTQECILTIFCFFQSFFFQFFPFVYFGVLVLIEYVS